MLKGASDGVRNERWIPAFARMTGYCVGVEISQRQAYRHPGASRDPVFRCAGDVEVRDPKSRLPSA